MSPTHSSCGDNDENKNQPDGLSIFCREVRNLLRSKPNCMVPFSKFVPAYHNHYGRQCCVYQFGYTKLIELLESIPHVVQIIGDGTNRYITLTHREQIKRFASDLIKVVKAQPGKKLKLSQFAQAYERVLGRIFRVEDYGTNNINVLLAEIWEGTINIMPIKREFVDESIVKDGPLFVHSSRGFRGASSRSSSSGNSSSSRADQATHPVLDQLVDSCEPVNKPYITNKYPDAWFEIPRRERSDKEIKRTKFFVWDVIELLSNMEPSHSVTFSKFIPSYHYYFNRQCKVSIFGFSKLIDLFESISPDVVEIIDQGPGEEKIIKLAKQYWPSNRSRHHNSNNNGHSHHHHHHRTGAGALARIGRTNQRATAAAAVTYATKDKSISDISNKVYRDLRLSSKETSVEISEEEEDEDDDNNYDYGDVDENEANEADDDDDEGDDGYEDEGEDIILPVQAIDDGPTEEELMELEDELKAYEEVKAIQNRRSSRMAAILDIFKYSIY